MKAEDLREQFEFLLTIGLGVVAREIISNGSQLDRLLKLRQRKLPAEKIASRMIRWRWYVFVLCIRAVGSAADVAFLTEFPLL